MMPVVAQLPAIDITSQEPVLVLGFDSTHALCATRDGELTYVDLASLRVDWAYDAEQEVWVSSATTPEELLEGDDDEEGTETAGPRPI